MNIFIICTRLTLLQTPRDCSELVPVQTSDAQTSDSTNVRRTNVGPVQTSDYQVSSELLDTVYE